MSDSDLSDLAGRRSDSVFADKTSEDVRYLADKTPGPSCLKLTMSLVNDSLKF